MLGSKKSKLSVNGSDNVETLIGPHVIIQGDLTFSGGLYIEGKVNGKVQSAGSLKAKSVHLKPSFLGD